MTSCQHVGEIEDLALGHADGARATRARTHLASCASCRVEYEQFLAEARLFERRAEYVPPPQPLAVEAVAAHGDGRERTMATTVRVLVGVAACAAAIAGTSVFGPRVTTFEPPAIETSAGEREPAVDEPLACALPASGFVQPRALSSSSSGGADEGLACVASADRVTCEERVTSSVPTP